MRDFFKYVLLSVAFVGAVFFLWYFRSIVIFIAVSAVISLIIRPLFVFFGKIHFRKRKLGNGLCAFFTVLVMWIFVILFFGFTIPLIAKELQFLASVDVPQVLQKVTDMLSEALAPFRRSELGFGILDAWEEQLVETFLNFPDFQRVSDFFSSLAGFFGGIFVAAFSITFITFFFLKDEGLLVKGILLFLPSHYEAGLIHALRSIRFLLRRYFFGIVIQTCLVGALVTLGFSVMGMNINHAAIIGLFSGLMNVVPYLGPLIGALFGFVVGTLVFLQGPYDMGGGTLFGGMIGIYAIVQLLDNMVFQPLIFSNSVKAHPLEIFIIILISGYLSGIGGMFLAIPVYTILRVVGREFFNNYKLINKLTGHL